MVQLYAHCCCGQCVIGGSHLISLYLTIYLRLMQAPFLFLALVLTSVSCTIAQPTQRGRTVTAEKEVIVITQDAADAASDQQIQIITHDRAATVPQPVIKNVILMIGDGMGLSQVSSSFYFGATEEPNFTRFPYIGLSRTSSASHKVTDSASGATAFASGIKTYNGAIGMDIHKQPVPTIIERIEGRNIATGVIATSSITHATPGSFYAHTTSRNLEDSIAAQLVTSSVDFFAGGGLKYFNERKDSVDLLPALAQAGFQVDTSALGAVGTLMPDQKYGYLLARKGLPGKVEGRGDFLPDATRLALDYLSKRSDEGFFLMVEGSQIDWEGHGTRVEGIVQEVRDFDKAIGVALDYAEKHGNTLVIVTADHETGGFALSPPMVRKQWRYEEVQGSFYQDANALPSSAHTATLVPVFAYGPMAQQFAGVYHNNEIFHKMVSIMGW